MNYQPKNILVTGGAGFIGSHFVRYMLNTYADIHIYNLDLLTYAGHLENLQEAQEDPRHTFLHGNITDRATVTQWFEQYRFDTIVHFAAESHVDRSIADPKIFIETNIVGTWILLDLARQFWLNQWHWGEDDCRFHHISTDEVYGALGRLDPAFSETTPYHPNSPYSASKASADHFVHAYHHTYGLPITLTHCSNNYGPFQDLEKFIPTVINSCLNQKPIPLYGDGSHIRDWLYVEDHCMGIDCVIRAGRVGENYHMGGNSELSNRTVLEIITTQFDALFPEHAPHARLILTVADRAGHDWRYAMNSEKIQKELEWQPLISFKEGLAKTIAAMFIT